MNWQCVTKDGTTQTIIDSGVLPVITTGNTYGILFNDSVPNVKFYINRALVATSTTHLPTLTFTLTQAVPNTAQTLTLSSVAATSGSTAVYTGTITGGGSNAYAGYVFVITGFTNPIHNGTYFAARHPLRPSPSVTTPDVGRRTPRPATSSASNIGFLGTMPQGAANAIRTLQFTTTGFVNAGNNLTVTCSASGATGFAGPGATGVAETHAGTATSPKGVQMRYVADETPNGNLSNGISFAYMYAEEDLAVS